MEIFYQLLLSVFLSSLIGLEREYKRKEAGLRTYSLLALGSCLFTIIPLEFFSIYSGEPGVVIDPSRIIQAIAVGIGFIGGGVIFQQSSGKFWRQSENYFCQSGRKNSGSQSLPAAE